VSEASEVSEALVAKPLPEMIRNLGLAVAEANRALRAAEADMAYAINEAEIELRVAITLSRGSEWKLGAGGSISAFSVNASYARTYGFREEAASRIRLVLQAVPARAGERSESADG